MRLMKRKLKILSIGVGILLVCGYGVAVALDPNNHTQTPVAPVCQVDAGKLLEYVNAERSRLGAPQLQIDATLATAAKYKLDNMVAEKYFAHKMANGTDWFKYARDLGVHAAVSEDIGSNDNTPEQSWQEFKGSPAHYKSLTDPQYTRVGVSAQCTDFVREKAVEPGDEKYVGAKITDLTVVTLAGVEPQKPAPQPQVNVQQPTRSQHCSTTPIYSYGFDGYSPTKTLQRYSTTCY